MNPEAPTSKNHQKLWNFFSRANWRQTLREQQLLLANQKLCVTESHTWAISFENGTRDGRTHQNNEHGAFWILRSAEEGAFWLAGEDTIKCLGGDAGPGKSAELRLTTWKWKKKTITFWTTNYPQLINSAQLHKISDFRRLNWGAKLGMFRLLLISGEASAECSEITKTEHLPGRVSLWQTLWI